jgi:ABC-type nitrate/sulfonate/bicarbonate transport system substrate-binding protein
VPSRASPCWVCPPRPCPNPLKIGYSDWPGWVAWEVAIENEWFEDEGVDVQFEWFDYVASMDAFAAGQLDAVAMTNGDALVTGATGARNVMIIINDYSNGNDMIIAPARHRLRGRSKGQNDRRGDRLRFPPAPAQRVGEERA